MRSAALPATALFLLAAMAKAQTAALQDVSFQRDVLPILSDRCFACHGPDAQARKADLRLDQAESVFAPRDGNAIITPHQPEHSELLRRITANDDDVMPPRESNLQLSAEEVAVLHRWIATGAEWSNHWSFVAPTTPNIPISDGDTWSRNPIDSFVLAKLTANGMAPNRAADPAALLRRVSLDLTGLPPTLMQIDQFVRDPSDRHYQQLVDELLASSHYGERMAWPWLEASRYADTDGFQGDPTRTAWPWRDWLVRALNDNLPFDQFTLAVLAGDLLPNATDDQQLASGFLRNNAHNGEGGRIAEETRIENGFDRTETVATVWLGMTFECARCHDHKYDPISQRDYYRLFAFFDQTSETGGGRSGGNLAPVMRYVGDANHRARLNTIAAEVAQLETELWRTTPELDAQQARWETQTLADVAAATSSMEPATLGPWWRSEPLPPTSAGAEAMFATAFAPEQQQQTIDTDNGWHQDDSLVDGAPHGFASGTYTTYLHRTIVAATARRMHLTLGSDDAIKVFCNGELVLQNNTRRGVQPDQEQLQIQLRAGTNTLLIKIVNYGGAGGMYFQSVAETVTDLPSDALQALPIASARRTAAQARAVQRAYRTKHLAGFAAQEQRLQALLTEQQALRATGRDVSVMDELPTGKRRSTRLLERGDYQQPRDAVTAGTPAFLPPLASQTEPTAEPNRLALANWLVSPEHPLTARVAVNRAWQTLLGRGLVATTEDFGRQGDRASHPELLDWLAQQLVSSGWDMKLLHRLIVTSSTYRQAATATPEAFASDPHNTLLGRSSRHRLPAWMLRDQALQLSGQLVTTIGGAPVSPYQPAGIWAEATFDTIRYQQSHGADLYRRSLYVFWRRIVGPTVLFDTQARQACVVRRSITNTPLHALTTMNETGFVESARALATRAYHAGSAPAQQIAWLLRIATGREPTPAELRLLQARLRQTIAHFTEHQDAAQLLLAVGESTADTTIPMPQLAALTVLASTVLNLDEVLTRP